MKYSFNRCIVFVLIAAGIVLVTGCANTQTANQFVLMDELQKKPYANREVWVKTSDGQKIKYVSDEQGLVKLPSGEKFKPENLEVVVCQVSRQGCTAPPGW